MITNKWAIKMRTFMWFKLLKERNKYNLSDLFVLMVLIEKVTLYIIRFFNMIGLYI